MLRVTDQTLPIICLQSAGRITREEMHRAMAPYDKAYAIKRKFVAVNDVRLANFDAQQRALWAEWTAHSAKHDPGSTLATIMIMENALMRGALTALNWIAPHAIPQYAVADVIEAIEVARKHLAKADLHCPPETYGHVRVWIDQGYAQAKAG